MTYQSEKEKILAKALKRYYLYLEGPVPFDLLTGEEEPIDRIKAEASHAIDELVKKWVIGEDEVWGSEGDEYLEGAELEGIWRRNDLRVEQRQVIDNKEGK